MEPLGSLETPEPTRPLDFLHLAPSHTEEVRGAGALAFSTF